MKTQELIDTLKLQSVEIAKEGHAGWGNTMMAAADLLESLPCEVAGYTHAMCCAALDDGKDPRQIEGPEIIRKISETFISANGKDQV